MSHLKYLIHYSKCEKDYKSIMKDGYLTFIPEKCQVYCEGIYTQAVFDDMPFFGYYTKCPIYINKSILLNRKDYIIKERGYGVTNKYTKEIGDHMAEK